MKQRIVIKVGTSSLLTGNERPSSTFKTVADGVKDISREFDPILVTSGAIGFGIRKIGLDERPIDLPTLQALSAIGQVGLMIRWQEAFGIDVPVSQVLLTARELGQPRQVEVLAGTIRSLWDLGAVPIVNENDAIANSEISFGDNDHLAALTAIHVDAHTLVLLTDQDGVQEQFGTSEQRTIRRLSLEDAGRYIDVNKTDFGTGGMTSKVAAARIALGAGIQTYIGNANVPISDLLAGKSGTEIV